MYSEEWLYGSIRKYAPETRAVWTDLQAMASKPPFCGKICISENIGYSFEQLAGLFNTPVDVFINAIDIFVFEKYISISDNKIITLLDWEKYQSEYDRLRKYKKGTEKSTKKGTEKSTEKCTALIRRRTEGEREQKERAVPAHPLFPEIVRRFGIGYESVKKVKYMDYRKDVKTLKQFLQDFPDIDIERFFDNVEFCAKDNFHTHNLSIRYVCNNFSLLEAKRLNSKESND